MGILLSPFFPEPWVTSLFAYFHLPQSVLFTQLDVSAYIECIDIPYGITGTRKFAQAALNRLSSRFQASNPAIPLPITRRTRYWFSCFSGDFSRHHVHQPNGASGVRRVVASFGAASSGST